MPRQSSRFFKAGAGKQTALRPASELGSLDRENAALEETYGPLEPRRRRKTKIQNTNEGIGSVEEAEPSDSPPKSKIEAVSSSSLSETSQLPSPTTAPLTQEPDSQHGTPSSSGSSLDSHQPPPAASVAQYQTFGPDPTTFDDPTVYHIREVTPNMADEEKKEIYCVAKFPHDDLSHLIAGTPPDKDFSNAKPTNQVNANTFLASIDPFLRPINEEDMAFLRERVSWELDNSWCLRLNLNRVIE